MPKMPSTRDRRAQSVHDAAYIFDSLSLDYVLEEEYVERLRKGGVDATIVSVAMGEETWVETLAKLQSALTAIDRSDVLQLVRSYSELTRAQADGQIGIIIGFQGASMVGPDLGRLSLLKRLGLRVIQLTYTGANWYGDGCGEFRDGGLTLLGKEFIRVANDEGLLLDLSHCGSRTTAEAIELAEHPIFTHANCSSIIKNGRNKSDSDIRGVAEKGGVIGVCCLPKAVSNMNATLDMFVEHIDHAVATAGIQHVGLGLDLTEGYRERRTVLPDSIRWRTLRPDIFGSVDDFVSVGPPKGLESVQDLPNLTSLLLQRGYSEDETRSILGQNWREVIRRNF